jgi:hypothetical protein
MLLGPVQTRIGAAMLACVGGVTGGLLVWLLAPLAPDSPFAADQAAASIASEKREASDVAARVDELQRHVASLRRRTAAREALAAFTRAAQFQGEEDPDGDTVSAAVVDQDDPTFELAVRGVMDRVREEQDLARQARRLVKREDRARRLTLLLADELELSEWQQQEVEKIFADQFARYRELRRAARDAGVQGPVTPREKQQFKEQIREQTERETERQLAEVLDADQLELYRQSRDEEELKPGG